MESLAIINFSSRMAIKHGSEYVMKINRTPLIIVLAACHIVIFHFVYSSSPPDSGAYYTGKYSNNFFKLLGKSIEEVNGKINKGFTQIFYGDSASERLYFPVGDDMAYIEDINNQDVRTEGMSYGMMIAVQLGKKNEFDRLWKWAKTHMQYSNGPRKTYFAWQCSTSGKLLDSSTASDGEEWFVTSLFFASARWGNGKGIFNYREEAQTILDAMLNKESEPENDGRITNMFNRKEKLVVFVPSIQAAYFTDPSYQLPHYYELWARWSDKENAFWCDAAAASRELLKKSVDTITGLAPDYSRFDGTPYNPWGGGNDNFQYDAWRVGMNVAVDYLWFKEDAWEVTQSNRLLNFFYSKGMNQYGAVYTLNGKQLSQDHSAGLVAMNAVAALASTNENRKEFVQQLWDVEIPRGKYRYYDGMLYMLGMLHVSGNFKIYNLHGSAFPSCGKTE
jgi:oligosaccharide reducing-end xylanase